MHQPLFGAIFPVIIAAILYFKRDRRASLHMLVITPLAMLACAIWAGVPDLPKLIRNMDLYYQLHQSAWSNIFFLHRWIDAIEGTWLDPYTPIFNTIFTIVVALPMLAAWRELHQREKKQQEGN
ncbi:MAG: hypothetical protein ACNA71_06735 [Kiritimatiellia bacterium]